MSSDECFIDRLGRRGVIGRAVDVLMNRDGVSRDAAFELLVQSSTESHCNVVEKAVEIVRQRTGD